MDPTDKEIIEACAKLMGKDIVWLVNQEDPILEEHLCHKGMVPWNPMKDSGLCFDLMVEARMRVTPDILFKTVYVVSGYHPATVGSPYIGDTKAAYRRGICLMAYHIWDTNEKTIQQLAYFYEEARKFIEEQKNGRS